MRKCGLIFTLIVLLASCDSKQNVLVSWSPEKLKAGAVFEIVYNPTFIEAQIMNPEQVNCILESIFPESTQVQVVPMEARGERYTAKMVIPEGARIVGYKFEDENGLTEDNNRRGWNLLVSGEDGTIQRDSYYFLGKIKDGSLRPGAKPLFEEALSEYQRELQHYPQNFKVWYAIWLVRFQLVANRVKYIEVVKQQLDSLISIYPNEPGILKLAFDTYRTIIPNTPKAVYYGSRYLAEFPNNEQAAQIAYFMVFLNEGSEPELINERLKNFLKTYPDFQEHKLVYLSLIRNYLKLKQPEQAYKILKRGIEIDPDDFSNYVTIARYLSELKQFDQAKEQIAHALEKCTIQRSQIASPWINGLERQIQHNIDLASIYSALAHINFTEKDFDKAIQNRKKAIELGSPFPAYEWQNIGDTYFEMNKYESAKHAYAAALLKNPDHDGALKGLYLLFSIEKKNAHSGFEKYVREIIDAHQKEFARIVDDFELRDVNDKVVNLSSEKNKIIVLYFGATMLWKDSDIIDKLNRLASRFSANKNIVFWSISIEGKERILSALKDKPFRFRLFHSDNAAREKMMVQGFPTYIIIDKDGIERFRQVGELPNIDQILEAKIKQLLSTPIS